MNALKALPDHGQAVWLDFLSRGFIAKGGLKKLVDEDGLRGVTSNPSIFEQAIGHSDEYDDAIAGMLAEHDRSAGEIFEQLAVEDIQKATDVLRPVFDATHGADGFVSIEVSPYLATDTKGTIAEAKRLWREIDRKNLMIKVPATPEGLPAIHDLIADGINVNITLLFAQQSMSRSSRPICPVSKRWPPRAATFRGSPASRASLSAASTPPSTNCSTKRSRAPTIPTKSAGSMRSRARSPSPMPSWPISAICACSPASAGRRSRPKAPSRSGCCGRRPAPRTRPIATCSMSRS